ncbi:MAG: hypothetical protein U1E73_11420 [Planctomycetota bacterium]
MDLTGTWIGEYTLGAEYGAAAGTSVPFVLSLTESALRGGRGYVRDDTEKGGQPGRGRIHGRRRGTHVRFRKTMPENLVRAPDGAWVPLHKLMREQHGIDLPADLPPHRIDYVGTVDAVGGAMSGEWHIVRCVVRSLGIALGTGAGTWSARRTADEPTQL